MALISMRRLLEHAAENDYGVACGGRSRGPSGDATPELAGGHASAFVEEAAMSITGFN